MKVDMNEIGVLTITAESGVEAVALRHWTSHNWVEMRPPDVMRSEKAYWRSSGLIVKASVPQEKSCSD